MHRSTSVRTRMFRASAIAAVLFSAAMCEAQMNATSEIRGQINAGNDRLPANLTVEIVPEGNMMGANPVSVSSTGEFECDDLRPGAYEIRVLDGQGNLIHTELVNLGAFALDVTVYLQKRQEQATPGAGTVSFTRLRHKVPPKAAKEFARAAKASDAGKIDEFIEHLNNAVAIDPDYVEAHNNLGVGYLKLKNLGKAAAEFAKASELDDHCAPAFTNLSVALYGLNRFPEAEKAARAAIALNGTDRKSRMMFGLILFGQNRNDNEALEQLRSAEDEYPRVRLAAASLLAKDGHKAEAVAELRQYLASGTASNPTDVQAKDVEAWIARLEQQPASLDVANNSGRTRDIPTK